MDNNEPTYEIAESYGDLRDEVLLYAVNAYMECLIKLPLGETKAPKDSLREAAQLRRFMTQMGRMRSI